MKKTIEKQLKMRKRTLQICAKCRSYFTSHYERPYCLSCVKPKYVFIEGVGRLNNIELTMVIDKVS